MYLLQRTLNIKIIFTRTTRLSNELNFIKLRPFRVLKVLELVTYNLDLSDSIKITKIHYILVLELADPEAPLIKNILNINPESQKKVWKIKKIVNSKLINNNKRKYCVK